MRWYAQRFVVEGLLMCVGHGITFKASGMWGNGQRLSYGTLFSKIDWIMWVSMWVSINPISRPLLS